MKTFGNHYFYGWYFRCCQGDDIHFAVIPAIHICDQKRSCSIQIITEWGSWNKEFPIEEFRIDQDKTVMQIGSNLFSQKGIQLNLVTEGLKIKGTLRFGNFAKLRYDIMGPFCLIPVMECRHTVYSMRHSVCGRLQLNERCVNFQDGQGYMEGDSGSSFPSSYIWTQHFFHEGALMIAVATVPIGRLQFTGVTGFLFWRGKEYRLATYCGAVVEKMGEREVQIRQGKYRLKMIFPPQKGRLLNAPSNGKMIRRIRENVCSRAEYMLMYKNRIVFRKVTDQAAVEYEMQI